MEAVGALWLISWRRQSRAAQRGRCEQGMQPCIPRSWSVSLCAFRRSTLATLTRGTTLDTYPWSCVVSIVPQLQNLYNSVLHSFTSPLRCGSFVLQLPVPSVAHVGLSSRDQSTPLVLTPALECPVESNAMLRIYILCRETITITGCFSLGQISEEKQCDLPSLESSPRMRSCRGDHALQTPFPHWSILFN